MSRLWDRPGEEALDLVVERFTVGRDPELDGRLVAYDALGSAAHVRMLEKIGILSPDEAQALVAQLAEIAGEARRGRFQITRQEEDGHTAIENRLTAALGDAGRRVHTGRSRNDQVIAAVRLYGREAMLRLTRRVIQVGLLLCDLADTHRETSVAGYSHTRQAMPSTFGQLFLAHAEALADDIPWLETAFRHLNRSPLGSASGYGVPLPLDRQLVADLLAFDSVQANTIAVQNDRGKAELLCLGAALSPVLDLSRLAADLIWFSSEELAYVGLSSAVTTGSSIMPQKRNPDVLELVRSNAGRLRSRQAEVGAIFSHLPSGYHRDLQLTKEPFLEGMEGCIDTVTVMVPVLTTLTIDADRCRELVKDTTGATDAMYQLVAAGEAMRRAYKKVAADPASAAQGQEPAEMWRQRTHQGAPGALDTAPTRRSLESGGRFVDEATERLEAVWPRLTPLSG